MCVLTKIFLLKLRASHIILINQVNYEYISMYNAHYHIIYHTPQYFISLHKRDADGETRFSKAEINFLPTVCVLHIVLISVSGNGSR